MSLSIMAPARCSTDLTPEDQTQPGSIKLAQFLTTSLQEIRMQLFPLTRRRTWLGVLLSALC